MLLEIMAELNMVSDSLVDWFLSKPHLVTEGVWPMRNVVCICNFLRASRSHARATQLAGNVLMCLHSTSFQSVEQKDTVAVLVSLQAFLTHLPVVQFLEAGDVDQRMRVLVAAAEASLAFDTPSLVTLAQGLLHESIPKSSTKMSKKTELCSNFMRGHCKFGAACHFAHNRNEIICKRWINGTCTLGNECHYQHSVMESLLVLIEAVDSKNSNCTHANSKMTSYLLDIFRPSASSVGPVQQVLNRLVISWNGNTERNKEQVFDRLARQQSTADSGGAGLATVSSSFPFLGGAAAALMPGTGGVSDGEMSAYLSSSSSYLPGCSPPLSHVSNVASQASSTSTSTNTTASGNKNENIVVDLISSSRDKSFGKNSSETCDEFEDETERTQHQHDKDNTSGLDCEQDANLLDAVDGVIAGSNMQMEVTLHLGGDQAGVNLDLDRTRLQDAVVKVCHHVAAGEPIMNTIDSYKLN